MSLADWFRRWNSPEARQERKKERQERSEAKREADELFPLRIYPGPTHIPDDNDAGPPED